MPVLLSIRQVFSLSVAIEESIKAYHFPKVHPKLRHVGGRSGVG